MDAQLEIQDLKGVIRRRKKSFLIPFLLIFLFAGGVAFMLPPIYRSVSKIFIEGQQIPAEIHEQYGDQHSHADYPVEAPALEVAPCEKYTDHVKEGYQYHPVSGPPVDIPDITAPRYNKNNILYLTAN